MAALRGACAFWFSLLIPNPLQSCTISAGPLWVFGVFEIVTLVKGLGADLPVLEGRKVMLTILEDNSLRSKAP